MRKVQNSRHRNDRVHSNMEIGRRKFGGMHHADCTLQGRRPYGAITVLTVIIAGCLLCQFFIPYDPTRMMLDQISQPPSAAHLFGTDPLGRDLFSMIWYGGRISLAIGLAATLLSTGIAILYGTAAGLASKSADDLLMRLTEILMSIPQILLVIFLQAIWGEATVLSISLVIGLTGWMAVAKMVRSEVKQLRNAGFVLAARTMGQTAGQSPGGDRRAVGDKYRHESGDRRAVQGRGKHRSLRNQVVLFLYILWRHLLPNTVSAILFMVVSNIGSAITLEATLSFMGLGFPSDVLSWGSLLSLSQRALLSDAWWVLLIPGAFLVMTLICITEIGEYLRIRNRRDRLM